MSMQSKAELRDLCTQLLQQLPEVTNSSSSQKQLFLAIIALLVVCFPSPRKQQEHTDDGASKVRL